MLYSAYVQLSLTYSSLLGAFSPHFKFISTTYCFFYGVKSCEIFEDKLLLLSQGVKVIYRTKELEEQQARR